MAKITILAFYYKFLPFRFGKSYENKIGRNYFSVQFSFCYSQQECDSIAKEPNQFFVWDI